MNSTEFKLAIQLVGGFQTRNPSTPLVIVGGGVNVWSDYKKLTEELQSFEVLCINGVGVYSPRNDYWFSLHADHLVVWALTRKLMCKARGPYKGPQLIALKPTGQYAGNTIFPPIDVTISIKDPIILNSAKQAGATEDSGFIGMCLAIAAGYEQIYLVGMPADDSGHVFVPKWEYLQHDRNAIRKAWEYSLDKYPIITERVRSTSGLTQELLGGLFR